MKFKLAASSSMGLESIIGRELKELKMADVKIENGRVLFSGGIREICKANLWLRCANRVKIIAGEFKAKTFDELFDKTNAINWHELIPLNGSFPVSGRSVKSALHSVPRCQAIVKKSMVESLKKNHGIFSRNLPENGPVYPVEVAINKDIVTLSIDTTGMGLHRRGYRENQNESPIKETLAAGIIKLSKWKPDFPLADPFCGSGTIPIEAAMMGLNIAPGLNREFVCEKWSWIDEKIWDDVRQEAEDLIDQDGDLMIFGSDLDKSAVEMSINNAKIARVNEYIDFKRYDIRHFKNPLKRGYLVTNPPYGERLSDEKRVVDIYKNLGRAFNDLTEWWAAVITSYENFEKAFGFPATKKRKLYNGRIKANLYMYH